MHCLKQAVTFSGYEICKIRGSVEDGRVILQSKNCKIMETTIEITRETVFRQVARRMEWTGTRSPKENDYSRLAMSDADKNLYQSLFDEAAMHAIDICRPFLKSVSNTDESLRMKLRVNEETDTETLGGTAANMIAHHVLALWQEIVAPDRAAGAYSKRDDYGSKLQGMLYHQRAPRREIHNS